MLGLHSHNEKTQLLGMEDEAVEDNVRKVQFSLLFWPQVNVTVNIENRIIEKSLKSESLKSESFKSKSLKCFLDFL